MRQLSAQRPDEKLRGVKRRLRALGVWASRFEGWFPPPAEWNTAYSNYKIPVVDRLVRPPHTTREIQATCLRELLRAAGHLAAARPAALRETCRIGVLLTLPDMWDSEVTVFFCRDYYRGFVHNDAAFAGRGICAHFGVDKPAAFIETGTRVQTEDELEDGVKITRCSEWWTIGEPL